MDASMRLLELKLEYLRKVNVGRLQLNKDGFEIFIDGVTGVAAGVLGDEMASDVMKREAGRDILTAVRLEVELPKEFRRLKR